MATSRLGITGSASTDRALRRGCTCIASKQGALCRPVAWYSSSECQGKLSFFYSGAGRRCSPQGPEGGKTLQPPSEESVCFWKRRYAKRLDHVTFRVLRKGPGCSASERTGSLVKTKMRWTSPYLMDEVSMLDPQQRRVPSGTRDPGRLRGVSDDMV